eukprot:gene4564-828_t
MSLQPELNTLEDQVRRARAQREAYQRALGHPSSSYSIGRSRSPQQIRPALSRNNADRAPTSASDASQLLSQMENRERAGDLLLEQ